MKRVDRCGRCFVLNKTPTRKRESYGDREVFDICGGETEVDILLTDLSSRSVTRLPSLFLHSRYFSFSRSFQRFPSGKLSFISMNFTNYFHQASTWCYNWNFSVLIGRRIWANGAGRGVAPACPFCVSNDGGRLLGNGCFDQCWLRWPIQSICPFNFRDCAIDSFPPKKLKATDPSLAFHWKSLRMNIQMSLCSFKKFSIFFSVENIF